MSDVDRTDQDGLPTRREQIRNAMLHAARRRRMRRFALRTCTATTCVAALAAAAWLELRASHSPPPIPSDPVAAAHPAPTDHAIAAVSMSHVIERSISDAELVKLLREAGVQAGLMRRGGDVRVVPWHVENDDPLWPAG